MSIPVTYYMPFELPEEEKFPDSLVCRPIVGDFISSEHKWDKDYILSLVVTLVAIGKASIGIHLGIPKVLDFTREYQKATGKEIKFHYQVKQST